jgi:hypothetical protein
MAKVPSFAKAFAGRWRIVERDTWDNAVLDLVEEAHITFTGASDGKIVFGALQGFLFRASWTCATARVTDRPVPSSHGRARTTTIPPVGAGGPAWEPPDGWWGTSTSTSAMTQASSANAPDFFSSLLVVWMRDVLGARDDLKGLGQAAGIERRVVAAVDARWGCAEALAHDPLG